MEVFDLYKRALSLEGRTGLASLLLKAYWNSGTKGGLRRSHHPQIPSAWEELSIPEDVQQSETTESARTTC